MGATVNDYDEFMRQRMRGPGQGSPGMPANLPQPGPAPSPGLGAGAPMPFQEDDRSFGDPSGGMDPLLLLLTMLLNRRHPNER